MCHALCSLRYVSPFAFENISEMCFLSTVVDAYSNDSNIEASESSCFALSVAYIFAL